MSYEWGETLREEGETVAVLGSDMGYEWSTVEVWKRHSDGRLFMVSGSGCSCNYLYDEVDSWDDMVPVTRAEQVIRAADQVFTGSDSPRPSTAIKAYQAVNDALRKAATR